LSSEAEDLIKRFGETATAYGQSSSNEDAERYEKVKKHLESFVARLERLLTMYCGKANRRLIELLAQKSKKEDDEDGKK